MSSDKINPLGKVDDSNSTKGAGNNHKKKLSNSEKEYIVNIVEFIFFAIVIIGIVLFLWFALPA